ncbi:major facilitator superfamily domain-containing protein [Ilyonectria robusta]|uniref:major facilitator superfamily domain-containing protein n=1 Tax=Ilyonectria robusta TaxID=1079257 RepID=UPI001E8EF38A|nr:major facilitator superfamily domain-containing protein [Ilyonectria robusta]KAH8647515.1 major facilitator superfamily domain-containing protein [Ilyonectria robusta]
MQALMAHLAIINTWGKINSFGIFQIFYATKLAQSSSEISWIGSIQVFFLFVVGVFTGRPTDAGYFRAIFATGSALVVLGSFMASISTTYLQLFFSQGVCTGLVGFPWTMRTMAFVQLATLLVANIFMRARLPPRRSGPLVELSAFRELPYSLFTIGMIFYPCILNSITLTSFSLGRFSRDQLFYDYASSLNLLILMNGVGAIGRALPGFLADLYVGPLNVITPAAFVCTIMLYCWTTVGSPVGLYSWAVIYVQGLFPAALSSLTTDLQKAGTRMGMVYSIISFANLTGPPLAGALISEGNGVYTYAFAFGGTCIGSVPVQGETHSEARS